MCERIYNGNTYTKEKATDRRTTEGGIMGLRIIIVSINLSWVHITVYSVHNEWAIKTYA